MPAASTPYDRPSDPAKRHSAALTDGPDRAGARSMLKAIGFTIVLAVVGTTVIAMIIKAVIGLRPTPENEEAGLDETDHGEAAYHMDEAAG